MAFLTGENHYVAFFLGDPGHTTAEFQIDIFTVDGGPVSALTRASFAIVDVGAGYYYAKYVPSTAGFYVFAFSSSTLFVNFVDAADILDVAPTTADVIQVVNLTQNTGGTGALKPRLPESFSSGPPAVRLSQFLLMVFRTSDWNVGRQENNFVVAMTELDDVGNWRTSPLAVPHDTYHVIIRNNYKVTKVVKASLEV